MVKYKLKDKTAESLTYLYYPEGRTDRKPGIISVDRISGNAIIAEVAEGDTERDIPPEEMNILVDAINEMVLEREPSSLLAYVDRPIHSIYYGDHAVSDIRRNLSKGEIPESGGTAWY